MTLHHKNKTICIINPLENELSEHFIDRCNFITSQNMKNDAEYNKVVNYSYIYSSNKHLGCIYDNNTMEELKIMIKKVYVI